MFSNKCSVVVLTFVSVVFLLISFGLDFDAVFDFEKSVNSSTHHVAKENCKWIYLIPAKVLPAFLVDCQLNFDYDFKKFNNPVFIPRFFCEVYKPPVSIWNVLKGTVDS